MAKLSVVVPVYCNEETIDALYKELTDVARQMSVVDFEYIFVDDGSEDNSFLRLQALSRQDSRVKVIKLSRNFGSFIACMAGLYYVSGNCAAIMAADLQDDPALLIALLRKWEEGNEVVMAVRKERKENFLKICFAKLYYVLMRAFSLRDMPIGGFDFVLIDRKVINALKEMKEKNTSLMGQILWTGFKRGHIYYTKRARTAGRSRWTTGKKIKYFIDSFVAFSYFPIRFMSVLGLLVSFVGFVFAVYASYKRIFVGVEVPGFTLLLTIILLTSGVQMTMTGVLGEYLWRNFDATRKRPLFIIDTAIGFDSDV